MSEQEQVLSVVHALFRREGSWWKAATILLAIPMIVGALVATFTYTFIGVTYLQKLNYAKDAAPVTVAAVREVRDSLYVREGYVFSAPITLPK